MEEEDNEYREIRKFIIQHFGLENRTVTVIDSHDSGIGQLNPDLILDDGKKRYFIEIAPKSEITKISHLILTRELLKANSQYRQGDLFILIYKAISDRAEEISKKVGIVLLMAPVDLMLAKFNRPAVVSKVKTTSEKSWEVIYGLLKLGPVSIKKVSDKTGVSYGWAHAVISSLLEQGLASKEFDLVKITDLNKLFNGMAWERPLESLKITEVMVESETPFVAAREITRNLKAHGIKFAFNSITAGGLYTGRVIRHDTAYVYLEKSDIDRFRSLFSSDSNTGIKIKIFSPDRDVFSQSQERESVVITSPGQTLLDLACTGYGSLELTKAMAEYNETVQR